MPLLNLATLKLEHPEAYAQALAEGVTQGVAKENDRVNSHRIMGEASGDMKTAMAAIEDGSEMTATIQATYMAAGMNRKSEKDRTNADGQQSDALDGADSTSDNLELDMEDQVAKALCEGSGIEWEGKK